MINVQVIGARGFTGRLRRLSGGYIGRKKSPTPKTPTFVGVFASSVFVLEGVGPGRHQDGFGS